MIYRGYVGRISDEGGSDTIHGEIVGIRDVVTFQGRDASEIEKAFRESVDDYVEFCALRGELPNSTGTVDAGALGSRDQR
jgi:predicted HicB family RNase H-like nuclease